MKTIEEKSKLIKQYCDRFWDNHFSCYGCPLFGFKESCWKNPSVVDRNYELVFPSDPSNACSNPYWERITRMADRQREKGISTYGQGLERFTTPDALKRIDYIQEELIDALMYLEWLKEKLKGDIENGTKEENT